MQDSGHPEQTASRTPKEIEKLPCNTVNFYRLHGKGIAKESNRWRNDLLTLCKEREEEGPLEDVIDVLDQRVPGLGPQLKKLLSEEIDRERRCLLEAAANVERLHKSICERTLSVSQVVGILGVDRSTVIRQAQSGRRDALKLRSPCKRRFEWRFFKSDFPEEHAP